MKTVCVYCASSTKIDPAYTEAARCLGTLLGSRGIRVVNGTGNMGLMGTVSDAALAASIFHYGQISIPQLKTELSLLGIPVRLH